MTRKEQIKSAYKLCGSNASFFQSLQARLSGLYQEADTAVEGIGCFCCRK